MRKYKYPNNCQSVFCLTYDVDATCMEEYYLKSNIGWLSAGDYGPKAGVPHILDLFDKLNVKGTFHLPGRTAERFPEVVKEMYDRGHEVASHGGYWHRDMSLLPEEEEWEEISKTHKIITDITGVPPRGYRSPAGTFSTRTIKMMQKLGSYTYTSTSMADIYPSKVKIEGKEYEIAELPNEWFLDDFPFFWGGAMTMGFGTEHPTQNFLPISGFNDCLEYFIAEFDHIHEMGGCCILINHPRAIGRPARLRVLEKFIRHVRVTPGGVWMTTEAELADWVLKGGLKK